MGGYVSLIDGHIDEVGADTSSLFERTAKRLARMGIKDPTAQVIALAKECEEYRAQIIQMRDYIAHLGESRKYVTLPAREAVYREAIAVHGATAQQIVALEELSEAQKEICKLLRNQGSLDHLAEEVADATIVLEQVRLIHGINDLVDKKMYGKVERLRRNLEAVKASNSLHSPVDRCVCCGEIIPEGSMVCPNCREG